MKSIIRAAAVSAALLASHSAFADEGFYVGLGAAGSSANSDAQNGTSSTGGLFSLGGTLGYRMEQPGFFYGAEVDTDISLSDTMKSNGVPCSSGANGPYYCSHAVTVRMRGIVGTEIMNGVEGFGTLGVGLMGGQGATNTFTDRYAVTGGFTLGGGVQVEAGPGMIRGEYIYDNFRHNLRKAGGIYTPDWEAHTAKVTYIIGF